jgi:hypothetical protein
MVGYVMNAPHPFAVVTGADGSFEIENVPVGEQRLRVWHATKGYVNEGRKDGMLVVVKAGAVTDVGEVKLGK